MPVLEGRADKESADGGIMVVDNVEREGGAASVGGVLEVPLPPGKRQT